MFLTITSTHEPATDLGYLLHKAPGKVQEFSLSFGKAHVFYPKAEEAECTAALIMDINPVLLARRQKTKTSAMLDHYVNDRPYVASSLFSVAMNKVFRNAMSGRSKERQELADTALDLQAEVHVVQCQAGEEFLRELFEPLGYAVETTEYPLDDEFPEWGQSHCYSLRLRGTVRLCELLTHLYVLLPVLDNKKHYWIGKDEVEKLLKSGDPWLSEHPMKSAIVNRYLRYRRELANEAFAKLVEEEQETESAADDAQEAEIEHKISLNQARMQTVIATVKAEGITSVADLGCGEGKLIRELLKLKSLTRITGMDVSHRALSIAQSRLKLDRMSERQRSRIELLNGSLFYRDKRLSGHDAATVIEVIEHLDQDRLEAFERVLFGEMAPPVVFLTTPNIEYNEVFENLEKGMLRHCDHRFEWTREEFKEWCTAICEKYQRNVRYLGIGEEHPELGCPTQMAIFTQEASNDDE